MNAFKRRTGALFTIWLVSQATARPHYFFEDVGFASPESHVLEYHNHPMENWQNRRTLEESDAERQSLSYTIRTSDWLPIRVHFVTELLTRRMGESAELDARITEVIDFFLPEAATQLAQHVYVNPVRGGIEIGSNSCFRVFGENALTPQTFTGADLVVVVGAEREMYFGPTPETPCVGGVLALSSACSLDQFDRPIVGFMNWCLGGDFKATTTNSLRESFGPHFGFPVDETTAPRLDWGSVALHEMIHVMGFTSWLFKYFRNPDGTPRTSRPFEERLVLCSDGTSTRTIFPSRSTVYPTISHSDEVEYMIATPRVQQVARNTLMCQSVVGGLLTKGEGCVGSHWSERLFLGELMSPAMMADSETVMTALTIALLEDTGWYRVDYENIGVSAYGLGAGCEFATQPCIQEDSVPIWGRGLFCDRPISFVDDEIARGSLDNSAGCDPTHQWWTTCDLWDQPSLPQGFLDFSEVPVRYFTNTDLVSTFALADSCPLTVRSLGVDCREDVAIPYTPNFPGERLGAHSRCIEGHRFGTAQGPVHQPACLPVRCDPDLGKVVIQVLGSDYVCEEDLMLITPDEDRDARLQCPRLAAVCPELASCPGACSGRGICETGSDSLPTCHCAPQANDNIGCFPVPGAEEEEVSIEVSAELGDPIEPETLFPTTAPVVPESLDPKIVVDGPRNTGPERVQATSSSMTPTQTMTTIVVSLLVLLML